ncbi:MAG: type II toxin-antitoxin system RelE/ParE family toxin [Xanthomonadales bacterium]|nr:type II toxin-antitoxin system RelE/ParE family toxin [Xanthomonadales bacterium]
MKVRLLDPAQRELVEAVEYYNNERAALGSEFRNEAWLAIQRIREFPDAWSPLGGHIRRCQLRRFPYGVIYEVTTNEIVVIAVAHLHRRPEYWRSRKR